MSEAKVAQSAFLGTSLGEENERKISITQVVNGFTLTYFHPGKGYKTFVQSTIEGVCEQLKMFYSEEELEIPKATCMS